jgi:catecholate siderophore receptor
MGPRLNRKARRRQAVLARRRRIGRTVGLGVLLAASTAFAQTTGQQEDVSLPPLQVSGQRLPVYRPPDLGLIKLPDDPLLIPQTLQVVPETLMREQAVFSLRDALRNVTGIAIQAGEGGGPQGDNLTLRGFSARTDIFVDGIRDAGQYTRDVFNIESIEVLKGPSAVFFGRGSTGGVINQVSKRPEEDAFYNFELSAGTGPLGRGTIDINQPLSPAAGFRLNAVGHYNEVVDRDEVDNLRFGVAPSFTYTLGDTKLTLLYFYQHEDNLPDYGVPILLGKPAPVSRDNFYGLADHDFEKTTTHIGTFLLEHEFGQLVSLRNALRYAYYDREATVTPPRIVAGVTAATPLEDIMVTRNRPGRLTEEDILANQTDLLFRFDTGPLKHRLVTGVDFAWQTFENTALVNTAGPNTPLLDPDPFPSGTFTRQNGVRTESETLSVGVYAVDEVQITKWLTLLGGLRFDYIDSEFDNRATGDHFERDDDFLSPRAAIIVQPTPWQSYYFAYGESSNPSAEQLNSINAANQSVPPEKSRSYELGAKYELFGNALGINASIFRIDKSDARTTDPETGIVTLDGEVRSQGFELGMTGRILPGWNVFGAYTYLDTEILEAREANTEGKELANAPEHTFSFWTTYDFLQKWQVGTGVFYTSERFGNNTNLSKVPGYVRWDGTLAYQVTKNIQLRLNVLNITDEEYFERAHPSHAIPGAGRTFIVSTFFTF